jgi:hypothetical protein
MAEPEQDEVLVVRGVWAPGDELTTLFADHISVTDRGEFFVLTVGQTVHPIVSPGQSDAMDKLRASGEIAIRPLIRVSVPKSAFGAWAAVLGRMAARISQLEDEPKISGDQTSE